MVHPDPIELKEDIRRQTHREDQVRTQGEDSHLRTRKQAPTRHPNLHCLDLGLPASRTVETDCCCLSQSACGAL